ncbi:cation:proton antiporter [Neptuniibacter sp. PT34_22]|uniref:cation:proton antiporter n=1 Tax=Neptuniibacter sp. PT34_22 TaxID=3398205 RepID=UPI0039F5D663
MGIIHILLLVLSALLAIALIKPMASLFKLPFALLLVVFGFLGSELITTLGLDTGLRWEQFHYLVFYLLLPALIFESTLRFDVKSLLKNFAAILLLSIPLMLFATMISAGLLYWGIGYPAYFTFITALLSGAILSATDPAAVISLLKQVGASDRLVILLEGESLFNDALAILLFGILSSLLLMPGNEVSFAYSLAEFFKIFLGGLAVGGGTLLIFGGLFLIISNQFSRIILTICAAYGGYLIAEYFLHLSGVMSVLVTGLGFGELVRKKGAKIETQFLFSFWEFNNQLASALIFVLLGVTITWGMFEQQWLAMLIGIGAVLLARALGLLFTVPAIKLLPEMEIDWRDQLILYWGGMRGAVAIALALSLPLEIDAWFTIQSIAYGVVLFSLGIQATTTPLLINKLDKRA